MWLRRNIQQTTLPPSDSDGNEAENENLEYVYDEVYFQTTASKEEIEAEPEAFWQIGQAWGIPVPETDKEKIARLENELSDARKTIEQNQMASDMAIAELTMVMAAMTEGGE